MKSLVLAAAAALSTAALFATGAIAYDKQRTKLPYTRPTVVQGYVPTGYQVPGETVYELRNGEVVQLRKENMTPRDVLRAMVDPAAPFSQAGSESGVGGSSK